MSSRRLLRFFKHPLGKLHCPRRSVLLNVSASLRRDAAQKTELELKQGKHVMKKPFLLFTALMLWMPCLVHAASLSAGFTYQGHLIDNGSPANGAYDLRFTLHSASSGANTQVGGTIQIASVLVTDGLFKEELDFGATPFDGEDRWLEIGVRPGGGTNSFTVLDPRQKLSPAPYALFAPAAGTAKGVAANAVSVTQLNTGAAPVNGQVVAYNGTALV